MINFIQWYIYQVIVTKLNFAHHTHYFGNSFLMHKPAIKYIYGGHDNHIHNEIYLLFTESTTVHSSGTIPSRLVVTQCILYNFRAATAMQ